MSGDQQLSGSELCLIGRNDHAVLAAAQKPRILHVLKQMYYMYYMYYTSDHLTLVIWGAPEAIKERVTWTSLVYCGLNCAAKLQLLPQLCQVACPLSHELHRLGCTDRMVLS